VSKGRGAAVEIAWRAGAVVGEPGDMALRIVEAPVPDSLDSPDSWALRGVTAIERAVHVEVWGYPDLAESLQACWAWARNQEYGLRRYLVAVAGHETAATWYDPDRVLGALFLHLPAEHNTHLIEAVVKVRPGHRGHGVGTALAERAEAIARQAGRRVVVAWSDHAVEPPEPGPDGPPVLRPPTGSGRIPDDAASRFARDLGYALEQAERHSVLELPAPPAALGALEDGTRAAAGADFRVVTWEDAAPGRWVDAYALLHTRMSTDVPLGGLDIEEEVWDAARVRDFERTHREAGHRLLVAAAEHVPSGSLAAFTVLVVRPGTGGDPDAVFQDATLVLREFRGRRLGMLVKLANVRAAQEAFPGAERIHTWNAEENTHMLAINVALGFRPAGISAVWQKRLG
jgi:GNAT superfamily N-acetyltransferase